MPLLQGIKRKYDPTNFFHFPQDIGNIPPEATAPDLSESLAGVGSAVVDCIEQPIVYLTRK